MQIVIFSLMLWFVMSPAQGGVYKWVDGQGGIHYSDRPDGVDAQEVQLPETSVYSPRRAKTTAESEATTADAEATPPTESPAPYVNAAFSIAKPVNDETIRSNEGVVDISFKADPPLRPDHKILLYLDGKKIGEGMNTLNSSLRGLDRGTHSIKADLVDAGGKTLASTDSVVFHLRKVSILFPVRESAEPANINPQNPDPGAPPLQ